MGAWEVWLRINGYQETMSQAEVYWKSILAGILTEYGGEYLFCYDESYLNRKDAMPVSLTLPLQTEAFVSPVLFPFFWRTDTWRIAAWCGTSQFDFRCYSIYISIL